ncbi:MAG: hypothetical protein OEZ06_08295 [Myxococcales bacterium]|nr:hypothetical protein [Myxococcales bacterium]
MGRSKTPRSWAKAAVALLFGLTPAASGCGDDDGEKTVPVGDAAAAFANSEAAQDGVPIFDGGFGSRDGASGPLSPFDDPCKLVEVRKMDLLFVVDNSGSMAEEQAALSREFPKLVLALTSGDVNADGTMDFPGVQDLHLGVVSTDMGLQGIEGIPGCGGVGDDGILQHQAGPGTSGCATSYPTFLTYEAGIHEPQATADDFACIATLGTEGCGFEQQLEAGLKALTPSNSDLMFLSSSGFPDANKGHGDTENAGFMRPGGGDDASVVAVVIVTDEEDCSSRDTRHLVPPGFLADDSPLKAQGLNTRCFNNPDNLFEVSRYVDGFKRLRPGQEDRLVFGLIAGVPPDLVNADARSGVDFSDATQRDAYYDGLLADDRMQEVVDTTVDPAIANLIPSCDTAIGKAYPPRRLVQVAKGMGESGLVQSICEDDFGPAVDALIEALAARVEELCFIE